MLSKDLSTRIMKQQIQLKLMYKISNKKSKATKSKNTKQS